MAEGSTVETQILDEQLGQPQDDITASGAQKPEYMLGLDVGGTKTAAILGTPEGEILDRAEIATRPQEGFEASFSRVVAVGKEVLERAEVGPAGNPHWCLHRWAVGRGKGHHLLAAELARLGCDPAERAA